MAEKPDKFPDWATEEEVDEVSGQANFVEPPDFRKESGWTRREIPPRQWFNWLARKTGLWFRWLEDQVDPDTSPFMRQSENLADLNDANAGRDNLGVPYASEAEALSGEAEDRVISPLGLRQGLNADNAPPVFGVRAWANFDGEDFDGSGIIQNIRGSGNISQIERISEGLYQITFDVPMPDEDYAVPIGMSQGIGTAGNFPDQANVYDFQTTGFKMESDNNTSTEFGEDCALLTFCVVR